MIGGLNPCPFRVGGGPTPSSQTYATMRRAVGKGGSAVNDLGIDGLWRRSRAKGLAAASSANTRAILNWFPHLATDALPSFARTLGMIQRTNETEADFRRRVWAAWVFHLSVDCPSLLKQLQNIDARFSILEPVYTCTTQFGKAFGSVDWNLPLNETNYPNYSTDMVLFVRLTLGYAGVPVALDQRLIIQAEGLLRMALPSWVDFSISTTTGFHLGHSPIGRVTL